MSYSLQTPWTTALQAPLSMGFSRQEYWSGLLCPPPRDLLNPGIEPSSPTLQADSLPSEPAGRQDGGLVPAEFKSIDVFLVCLVFLVLPHGMGFPGVSDGKESACNAGDRGDAGLIPRSGRYPGEGTGYPLQYSCLENSLDRGAWWATVHGVAKIQTQLRD